MTMENEGSPSTGLITARSINQPKAAMASMDTSTASAKGSPRKAMQASPANAPTIINSPWAKLTVSVAL